MFIVRGLLKNSQSVGLHRTPDIILATQQILHSSLHPPVERYVILFLYSIQIDQQQRDENRVHAIKKENVRLSLRYF